MARVREIGTDAPGVSATGLEGARHALLREIAHEDGKDAATRRRRSVRWIGGSALAGGVAAAALVIGFVAVPATAPTASAAEVLEKAAEATLTTTALSPAPGQYIRIQEVSRYELGWAPDPTSAEGGWWDSRSSATEATILQTRSLYVPADRAGDWVRDYDEGLEVLSISGPDAEAARPAIATAGPAAGLDIEVYPGGMYTQAGVGAEGVDPGDVRTFSVNGLACYYDEMPRDPAALARWARDYAWTPGSACPPPSFTEPENFNLAPADLRAAMFGALALTERARVVKVEGGVATIAFPEGGESDWMNTVDIDTTTGLMVGRGNLDDDKWSSRLIVSIVDALPPTVRLPQG